MLLRFLFVDSFFGSFLFFLFSYSTKKKYEPKKRAIIYYQNLLYLVHGRIDLEDLIANSVDGWIVDFAK